MLFVVQNSVSVVLSRTTRPDSRTHALDLIGLAVAEGKHKITGSRATLATLARHRVLNARTRAVFDLAHNLVADEMALQGQVRVLAHLEADVNNTPTSQFVGTQRIFTIPLEWIDDSAKTQPTLLLGENLSDTDIYARMAVVSRVLGGGINLSINARRQSGGGQTTEETLRRIGDKQEFCLCIVDSDRGYPGGAIGQTAKEIQKYKDIDRYPLLAVFETSGRDLENALPNSFYSSKYGDDRNHEALIRVIRTLTASGDLDTRRHLDFKKGLVYGNILGLAEGSPARKFWENGLPAIAKAAGVKLEALPCYDAGKCKMPKQCTCRILSGNNDRILESFERYCRNSTLTKIVRELDRSVYDDWVYLGGIVFDWCCAAEKLRS